MSLSLVSRLADSLARHTVMLCVAFSFRIQSARLLLADDSSLSGIKL